MGNMALIITGSSVEHTNHFRAQYWKVKLSKQNEGKHLDTSAAYFSWDFKD